VKHAVSIFRDEMKQGSGGLVGSEEQRLREGNINLHGDLCEISSSHGGNNEDKNTEKYFSFNIIAYHHEKSQHFPSEVMIGRWTSCRILFVCLQ
jgi:hypothetical protein